MDDKKQIFKDLSARRVNEESELVAIKYEKLTPVCSSSPEGDELSTEKKMKRLTLEPVHHLSDCSPTPFLRLT